MTPAKRLRRAEDLVARLVASGLDPGPDRLAKLERLRISAGHQQIRPSCAALGSTTRPLRVGDRRPSRLEDDRAWTPPSQSLIDWFLHAELPTEPFKLTYWMTVIDPSKYYASLRSEIACGPAGPRARNGALQEELALLRHQFDRRSPKLDEAS